MKTKSGIYKLTINNKNYVGMTTNIDRRKRAHTCTLQLGRHRNKYLQNAYNKYGDFDFEVLEETADWLSEKEIMWIDKLDTHKGDGYNMKAGGDDNAGEANGAFGMKRADLAELNRKGQGKSPESILKMRKNKLGLSDGSKNHQWRHDIKTENLVADRDTGMSYRKIAKKHNVSKYLVMTRINGDIYSTERIKKRLDLV